LGRASYGLAQVAGSGLAPNFVFLKKNPKNFKNYFKKIVIFSNIFLSILHNIGLYIYTIKYKFDIKIPDFLRNFSTKKTNFKKKKNNILLHTTKS